MGIHEETLPASATPESQSFPSTAGVPVPAQPMKGRFKVKGSTSGSYVARTASASSEAFQSSSVSSLPSTPDRDGRMGSKFRVVSEETFSRGNRDPSVNSDRTDDAI